MASSLGFMAINDTEIKPELPNHNEWLQDKLSTKKAQELISRLHTRSNEEEETELNMASFEELEKKSNFPENNDMFKDTSYINQYYNEYTNDAPPQNIETELMTKVNYMIKLLEENHDEKINNVSEEMILYCFLGVFMIFLADSFSRVGKYVR